MGPLYEGLRYDLINRNPTINYGSVLAMKCVGMVESYTMSVPLTCLKTLAADQLKRSTYMVTCA